MLGLAKCRKPKDQGAATAFAATATSTLCPHKYATLSCKQAGSNVIVVVVVVAYLLACLLLPNYVCLLACFFYIH